MLANGYSQGEARQYKESEMKILNGTLVALAVCGMASVSVMGCNTFRGAGKDIQRGGEKIEGAATK